MRLMVTGATGFLGAATVARLIEGGHAASLLLLVRSRNALNGLKRVRQALRRFEVPPALLEHLSERQILVGDLTDVPAFAGDARLDEVSHVLHCAGIASFGDHPQLDQVNVDGTLAFARRMTATPGLRRFVHVSAAMIGATDSPLPIRESWAPEADAAVRLYLASKATVEARLRVELPGLPLVVARPSVVIGHTRLGCRPSGTSFWVFRLAQLLGRFTCAPDGRIDVVPVDYCAEALALLLTKPQLAHDLYHISAGQDASCRFADIDTALASGLEREPIGRRYRRVGREELPDLARELELRLGVGDRRQVLRALRLYSGFAALDCVFDNGRLRGEGMSPPPFTSYAARCAQTSVTVPVLEQMRWNLL